MDKLWINPSVFSMCFLTCFSMFQHEHSSSIPALQVSHGISGSSPAPDESGAALGAAVCSCACPRASVNMCSAVDVFIFPYFSHIFPPLWGWESHDNPIFIWVKTWIPWISDEFHLLYLLECWDVLEDPAISLKEIASLLGPRACSRWRKHQADWNWQTESNEWWRIVRCLKQVECWHFYTFLIISLSNSWSAALGKSHSWYHNSQLMSLRSGFPHGFSNIFKLWLKNARAASFVWHSETYLSRQSPWPVKGPRFGKSFAPRLREAFFLCSSRYEQMQLDRWPIRLGH